MDLWQKIIKTPDEGSRELVAVYKDRLFLAARMMCGDDQLAEDLVFRTFSRVIAKISSFRPNTNFYNWIYTIMINFRRMDVRHANGSPVVYVEEPPEMPDERTPFAEIAAKADHAAIREAVSELSDPLKEVVLLRYFEDFPLEAIAETLTLPMGTVKSRLNAAKAKLARRLAGRIER